MTEIKHQHIVPACYLANWGINGNQGRKSEIYFFDVNNHQARVSSVNKLPTENYFYDIPELGEKKQLLENFFGVIEGEYAALLQKLLKRIEDRQNINSNKEPLLSTEDKNELTSQFAMQIVRTQAFRSGFSERSLGADFFGKPNDVCVGIRGTNYSKRAAIIMIVARLSCSER